MKPLRGTEGIQIVSSEEGETCWELANSAYDLFPVPSTLGLLQALDWLNNIPYKIKTPHAYTLLGILEFSTKVPWTPKDLRVHALYLLDSYYLPSETDSQIIYLEAA